MKVENLIYQDASQFVKDAKQVISKAAIGMALNQTWNPVGFLLGHTVQQVVTRYGNMAYGHFATEKMKEMPHVNLGANLGTMALGAFAGSQVTDLAGCGTSTSSLVSSCLINYFVNYGHSIFEALQESKVGTPVNLALAEGAALGLASLTVNGMADVLGAKISVLGLFGAMSLGAIGNAALSSIETAKEQEAESKSSVVHVTKENFQQEVLKSKLPVIVDAYATWCPPCKMLAPIFRELSDEMKGSVKFAKFNTDENQELTKDLNIQAMPTLIFYKDGKEVTRQTGALQKEDLAAKVQATFSKK